MPRGHNKLTTCATCDGKFHLYYEDPCYMYQTRCYLCATGKTSGSGPWWLRTSNDAHRHRSCLLNSAEVIEVQEHVIRAKVLDCY